MCIYWWARSYYGDRGLTLSGKRNGDTLLLREVLSDIPPSGHPDFRGGVGVGKLLIEGLSGSVCDLKKTAQHPWAQAPAETNRRTSSMESQGSPSQGKLSLVLHFPARGSLGKGETSPSTWVRDAPDIGSYSQLLPVSADGGFGGKARYSDEK